MGWMDELRSLLRRRRRSATAPAEDPATCQEALERIFEWLDGELDSSSRRRIGDHLAVCARCYPMVRFEEAFRSAVDRACAGETVPPDVETRILKALESAGLDTK